MKIIIEYPPNIEELDRVFSVRERKGVIFTYGAVIFNPDNIFITPELEAHESVHSNRQNGHVAEWWNNYLHDPNFRVEEEVAAHKAEYWMFCQRVKDRNRRAEFLGSTARRLSSGLYGRVISERIARERIR